MKNFINYFILLVVIVSQWSCSGARLTLKAKNLEYPVSMTKGTLNKNLDLTTESKGFKVIDDFSFSVSRVTTAWSLLSFGFFSFGETEDISNKINEIVKAKGGDGVIELKVNKNPTTTLVNFVSGTVSGLFGTLGGILWATGKKDTEKSQGQALVLASVLMPGYMLVHVEGKVIKFIK